MKYTPEMHRILKEGANPLYTIGIDASEVIELLLDEIERLQEIVKAEAEDE